MDDRDFTDPVTALAKERFGLDYLFPYQRLVAANILDAEEGAEEGKLRQIVLLPTGFGKSLCFQLPALLLPRPTVVVYPLLALMADQKRRLDSLDIPCALFRGGQEEGERRRAEEAVSRGRAKIVITNPECLASPRLLDFLKEAKPSHLAIDEAHCVSEWGESFRPSYLELGRAAQKLEATATSAFTATASPVVCEAVARILFGGSPYRVVEGDPDRPNIHYSVKKSLSRERSLEETLKSRPRPAIVFCSSREGTQILAERLRRRLETTEVRFYHAGLEREEKKAIEAWFFDCTEGVLVSTCAYGMGVDKKNIRTVIHYDPPASVEAYLQESGRGGRDGAQAYAILLAGPEDEGMAPREKNSARESRRKALIDYAAHGEGCRRASLLSMLGAELQGPCSGCDVCEGKSERGFEGEKAIREFARKNPRRFETHEALRLLLGRAGEPPTCAGAGTLAGWREEDASQALRVAARKGIVRIQDRGPWKGRLLSG